MKRVLCVLLGLWILCLAATVSAQDNRETAAEKLLDLMNLQAIIEKDIDMMLDVQVKQNPTLAPYKDVMRQFLNKYMSYASLKNEFIKLYTTEFTEQELQDMIAFYMTPTGQKAIVKMPALAAKGAELGSSQIQQHLPELKSMIEAEEKTQKKTQ